MPKATEHPITSRRTLPDLGPTLARFRQIAAESGDRLLLGDGPPHPDAALLDLCAETLHRVHHSAKALAEHHRILDVATSEERMSSQIRSRVDALMAEHRRLDAEAAPLLRRTVKIPAKTAAGIYAKALIVRTSRSGAAGLAMTLAADLIACPGLRESLWPAEPEAKAPLSGRAGP